MAATWRSIAWDVTGIVRLWLLDLDAGSERRLPMPELHFARGRTFSPDGSMIAFPMLHRIGPDQNAYEVGIAPIDGSSPAVALGHEVTLPANGSDGAFVSIESRRRSEPDRRLPETAPKARETRSGCCPSTGRRVG